MATSTQIQVNEGNKCDVNVGCSNISATVSLVAPGLLLLVIGVILAIYGYRKREGEEG